MLFKDIIGQEAVKKRLLQQVHDGRVPHALLFSGQGGIGKLQLAIAYAQYLACPNRTENDSCGVCPSCLQYQNLQHPDLHFAYPVVKPEGAKEVVADDYAKQWRDILHEKGYFDLNDWALEMTGDPNQKKQAFIYEKESSEILRKLSLKSFGNGYKTMIIWLPEKMYGDVCANKLLKILEEPPEQTLFILVSNEPHRLLPTILSRVQQVHIDKLSEDCLAQALRDSNEDLSVADSLEFAHVSNGSLLAARKCMQNDEQRHQFFDWFVALMRNAWLVGKKQNYQALLDLKKWSETMAGLGREKQKAFLDYSLQQVRENYITNYGLSEVVHQTSDERHFSQNFARFISDTNVESLMQQLSLAQRQIEQNGNAKIIFFDLCLQMIVLIK